MTDLENRQIADREADDGYPIDGRGFTDVTGAAQYTGLSESKLNKDRHFGTGAEYVTFGRAIRYSFAALDAAAVRNRRTCTRDEHERA